MDLIQLKFTIIVSILFIMIGISGNVISIVIFSNKEFKNISTTQYFKCICILNILMIMYIPYGVAPISIDLTNISCKIHETLIVLFPEIKSWVLAFCSLDRLVSVLSPHKFQFKNKLKFQLSAIFSIGIIVAVMTIPYGYFITVENIGNNQTICLQPIEPKWVKIYFKVQFFFLRTIIPFSIMIISSAIIGYKMHKKRRMLLVRRLRENHLLKSLIAMDIFFIVSRIPLILYLLVISKGDYGGVFNFNFSYSIIYAIGQLNILALVFLFICFNRKFRELLFKNISSSKCTSKVTNLS